MVWGKVLNAKPVDWEYPLYGIWGTSHVLGHSAIKVTLSTGVIFFLDDRWWGNAENIFGPQNVSWQVMFPAARSSAGPADEYRGAAWMFFLFSATWQRPSKCSARIGAG